MGDLMRQYWLPFFLSKDLESDGQPARVRLLGEDLIVFRATSGDVGLLDALCAHRCASLFFARNEEEGLRCVYHGWKYDVSGRCVDMPTEPSASGFKDRLRQRAYPCRERNGIVWTYMGPLAEPPDLPELEWNLVPQEQTHHSIRIAECNYTQLIEGEFDTTHIGFLHQSLDPTDPRSAMQQLSRPRDDAVGFTRYFARLDKVPRFELVDTPYGVLIATRRDVPDDMHYWRVYPFLMPFHTLVPPSGNDTALHGHAYLPMDDTHTICLCFTFDPTRPLTADHRQELTRGFNGMQGFHPSDDVFLPVPNNRPYARYWPKLNKATDYGFDYTAQHSNLRFSGLPGPWPQDSGMQESMGAVVDRRREHLGASDGGQIRIRRRLMDAARALRNHRELPPGAADPHVYWLRAVEAMLPRNTPSWVEATAERFLPGGPTVGLGDGLQGRAHMRELNKTTEPTRN
jgi:nitrite reductase/ring-hydroxylating ferredoxin subunit